MAAGRPARQGSAIRAPIERPTNAAATRPALLLGGHVPDGLLQAAAVGVAVFVVLCVIGALLFANDRVLRGIGRALRAASRLLRPRHTPDDELPERLLDERDLMRRSLGRAWPRAVATAAGRWIFDFLSLYAALLAVGAHPSLSVSLLAYCAAHCSASCR